MRGEFAGAEQQLGWGDALSAAAAAAFDATAVSCFSEDGVEVSAYVAPNEKAAVAQALAQGARRARSSALSAAVVDGPNGRVLAVATEAGEALAVYRRRRAFSSDDQRAAEALLLAWVRGRDKMGGLENALEALHRDFALSAHFAQFGIWSFETSTQQLVWSDQLYELYELDPLEIITWDVAQNAINGDRRGEFAESIALLAGTGRQFDLELPMTTPSGAEKWLRVFGDAEWRDGAVNRIFGFAQDITDEVMLRDDMTLLATRDYLTEVANRASFTNMFAECVARLDYAEQEIAFFVLDVDHFKTINDMLGHDVGDQILREVSGVLLNAVRTGDVVGRLGGDEFGIIALTPSGAGGTGLAERVLDMARRSPELKRVSGGVTLSIGYAEITSGNWDFKRALKAADLALYEAKRGGRDQACRYREELGVAYGAREQTLLAVDEALKAGQFETFYQAKVNLANKTIAGFEALARWRCPERGVLTPGVFFHAIEDPRLATRISDEITKQAIADSVRMRKAGFDPGPIALNATQKQLTAPDFAEKFSWQVRDARLEPAHFEIEITEAVLLARNVDAIRANLIALAEMGATIALDDFGTGFASFTHLRAFPIHTIKIDKSFVTDFDENRESRVICNALIGLAHDLGMRVVAEGVETAETAAELLKYGCNLAQGYYYGSPVSFENAVDALREAQPQGAA